MSNAMTPQAQPWTAKRELPSKPGIGHRQTQDLNMIDDVRDSKTPKHNIAEHLIGPCASLAESIFLFMPQSMAVYLYHRADAAHSPAAYQ